jgi:hypothetical protein
MKNAVNWEDVKCHRKLIKENDSLFSDTEKVRE